jgi:hypothetical protein
LLLIVYYVGFMIVGDLSDYLIGLIVEREFGSQASLIVFLALYFLFLWLSWLFAVWMTEPKPDPPPLKWSDLRYVFDIQEDCNGKEAIQA